jgi:MinD-like ATPase involved in chromosome partitioning or flagellar assembly
MSRVVVAVGAPHGDRIGAELVAEGHEVRIVSSANPARDAEVAQWGERTGPASLDDAEVLVLHASAETLTPALLTTCDRLGIRIVALGEGTDAFALAAAAGLGAPLATTSPGWRIAEAISAPVVAHAAGDESREQRPTSGSVIAVWGPSGAPGRSTVAVALAAELSRGGRRALLVDADTHAPSIALALGLADEAPGFAAACRQAERGVLDIGELDRISPTVRVDGGEIRVLTGINRPSRWPEVTAARLTAALVVCREWADHVVVDVASSLERDEEIVSDVDGPRRNAATLAVMGAADLVIAVLSADPLGASRFVREYPILRAAAGTAPIVVVANRLRAGALGVDPRGQLRATLDRFAGVPEVAFLPLDPRSADAAMLSARPLAEVAPRSPFTLAVRRLATTVLAQLPSGATSAACPVPAAESVVVVPFRNRPRRMRRPTRQRTA